MLTGRCRYTLSTWYVGVNGRSLQLLSGPCNYCQASSSLEESFVRGRPPMCSLVNIAHRGLPLVLSIKSVPSEN